MAAISKDVRERILSHKLDDEEVQLMLAGFLHQELRHVHHVEVPAQEIHRALRSYVGAVGTMLEQAIDAYEAGFRPF